MASDTDKAVLQQQGGVTPLATPQGAPPVRVGWPALGENTANKVVPEVSDASQSSARPPIKTQKPCKVPSFMDSLNLMASASWLTVNDNVGDGIFEQFVGEQTNTGLISALLLTIAVSNFYSALQPETPDVIVRWIPGFGPDRISDMCVCFYSGGTCGMMFATLSSVFYLLAANEAGSDAKVEVLLRHLGRWAQAPYLFFQLGIVLWATGYWIASATSVRTTSGLVALMLMQVLISLAFVFGSAQRVVQGTYVTQAVAQAHPPLAYGAPRLAELLREYARQVGDENIDYAEFRRYISTDPVSHFYAGLTHIAELRARHVFDVEAHRVAGVPRGGGGGD